MLSCFRLETTGDSFSSELLSSVPISCYHWEGSQALPSATPPVRSYVAMLINDEQFITCNQVISAVVPANGHLSLQTVAPLTLHEAFCLSF